ncbi:MAG: DUF1015 domain-containing protein [candidate division WOR-3 bacterium]
MADIRPFPGIRYNIKKIGKLDNVVTQPYDKITPEMRDDYLKRDPANFVRLILSSEPDPYASSAALCRQWLEDGTLIRDQRPAFYVLHEEFEHAGRRLIRKGFVGAVRVEEFSRGTVMPHEFTLSKPKADRLNLLRATRKDYEQIFMLYADPEHRVDELLASSKEPDVRATDEYGVVHSMWIMTDPERLTAVRREMAGKRLLIADGHHRYETALTYRQECERQGTVPQEAAVRFKTSAFVNIVDPGLVILPTHRLVFGLANLDLSSLFARLRDAFTITPMSEQVTQAELAKYRNGIAFVLYAGRGKAHLLRLAEPYRIARFFSPDRSEDYRQLDVSVLHSVIIEGILGVTQDAIENHVRYERYWDKAMARVDSGENQLAFLLNPTRPEQVEKLAARGERMPQKSTDFYPKLISGLVFMDIEPGLLLQP